jgi:membrane associated rhomboid family serine protease
LNNLYWRIRRFLFQEFTPVTKTLLSLGALCFVLGFILPVLRDWLVLTPRSIPMNLWAVLTYPLVNPDLISLLFAILWLWFIGSSLERTWGSPRYALFLGLLAGVTGLAMVLVEIWLGIFQPIYGFWLLSVGITWAWAELNPGRELLFWGIIPIRARWLAWLNALMIGYSYLQTYWLLGLASLSGILIAYWFVGSGGRGYRSGPKRDSQSWLEERRRRNRRKRFRIIH